MTTLSRLSVALLCAVLFTPVIEAVPGYASDALLQIDAFNTGKGGGKKSTDGGATGGDDTGSTGGGGELVLPTLQNWMSPEILDAWRSGYFGQGTTITVVDDFKSSNRFGGNLGLGVTQLRHGEWTHLQASMIAPEATMRAHDFGNTRAVSLSSSGLNVLNLSYGMMAQAGYSLSQIRWNSREQSIINYATDGRAVVSKAAGNDAVAVGAANGSGTLDYLNLALIGTQATIFVGALDRNGTPDNKASLAWYSNYAGTNVTVQNQFLAVGVEGQKTGLYGTSFAAPVVSGYAAVLGSKFTSATPTQIVNQLLATARIDTIANYTRDRHGRGEASIANALAPVSIR
jgi:subtilisin family serine protease